jgi:hypothetical protein
MLGAVSVYRSGFNLTFSNSIGMNPGLQLIAML